MFNDAPLPSCQGIANPCPQMLDLLGYTDAAAYVRLASWAHETGMIALCAHYEILAVEAARPLVLSLR